MTWSLRNIALGVVAMAALAYGVTEFRSPGGYGGLAQKRADLRALEDDNGKLRAEITRLHKRVADLATDPAAQELEIRKRYNKVKPGETVYLLQPDKISKTGAH